MKASTFAFRIPPFSSRLLQQPSSYQSLSGTCLKHMLSKCLVKRGQLETNATMDIGVRKQRWIKLPAVERKNSSSTLPCSVNFEMHQVRKINELSWSYKMSETPTHDN